MGKRPSDLVETFPIKSTEFGRMAPLLPHQKIMLDRACYAAKVMYDNAQIEAAKQGNNSMVDDDLERAKQRRSQREKQAKPKVEGFEEPPKVDESKLDKVKTNRGELPVVAIWDGGEFDSLSITGNIHMLPPLD